MPSWCLSASGLLMRGDASSVELKFAARQSSHGDVAEAESATLALAERPLKVATLCFARLAPSAADISPRNRAECRSSR